MPLLQLLENLKKVNNNCQGGNISYICTDMMGYLRHKAKWFCLSLFVLYVSGITLFTHSHVVNKTRYIHSHPFKFGEKQQHDHTEKEYYLLDHFFRTTLTAEIIPEIGITCNIIPVTLCLPSLYEQLHLLAPVTTRQLRAPPVAA